MNPPSSTKFLARSPAFCLSRFDPSSRFQFDLSRTQVQTYFKAVRVVPRLSPYLVCVLLLQDLLQNCSRGGRRRVEDMCYERRRAEACVDESAHHALVNAGGREIV
jgi:hypothetical protein